MSGEPLPTLRFVDRRSNGRFVVSSDDVPVAFIDRPWVGRRCTATTVDGSLLCQVQRRHGFSRYLDLFDGEGRGIGHLKQSRGQHTVALDDDRQLQLRNRWFGQGWVLLDEAGTEVLCSVRRAASGRTREQLETGRLPEDSPTIGGYRFVHESFLTTGPDDWLVTPDGSLDLARVVAIVEAYRILVKAARNHR